MYGCWRTSAILSQTASTQKSKFGIMITILLIFVGHGEPNSLRSITSRTITVSPNLLPTPDAAMTIYEQIYSGQLTEPSVYGTDLLEGNEHLQDLRCSNFSARTSSRF